MKKAYYILITFAILSCNKNITYLGTTNTQNAKVMLCNSNPVPYNGTLAGYSKWDIWSNNNFLKGIISDTAIKIISINAGNYRIKNYGISNTNATDTIINYYDTLLSFSANKIYSVFTTLGRDYNYNPTVTKPNAANVIEEKDTVSPANGFAKVRLLVCVPSIGQGASNQTDNNMSTHFVMYNSNGDTINYTNRYYLDHLTDTTLLKFTTIRSGSYMQFSNYPGYDRFVFTLESRKIYTIVINQMVQNRLPMQMDNPVLIKHSFQ